MEDADIDARYDSASIANTMKRPLPSVSDNLFLVAAPAIGIAAIVVAGLGMPTYEAPLFPALRRGIEGFNPLTALLRAAVGFALGKYTRWSPWLLAPAILTLLPVLAILEMLADSTSHNIWPIEFVLYGVIAAFPLVGALFARRRKHNSPSRGV